MRIKSFIVICSALFAASAFAQNVIGKVTEVQGVVTVTDGVRGGTANLNSPVVDGSRYVTSSNGTATLQLDNGCTIRLQPSQAVTVRNQACHLILVQSVGGATTVATGGLSRGAAMGLVGAGGAIVLLNAFDNDTRSISGN